MSALTNFLGLFKWTKEDLEDPSPQFDYIKSIADNLDVIDTGVEKENKTNTEQDIRIETLETDNITNKNSIEKNTANINNLNEKTTIKKEIIIVKEEIKEETEYELPLSYKVGNNSLEIMWEGQELAQGDEGNYIEIGTTDELSNIVKFGFDIDVGDVLSIKTRGVAENEK